MLIDFKENWKRKGLPTYMASWQKWQSGELINNEPVASYAPVEEIELISPFREKDELEFQIQGNRYSPNLNASCSEAVGVEDLIEFEGNLFKVFEVEKQDLVGIFYFKAKFLTEEEWNDENITE